MRTRLAITERLADFAVATPLSAIPEQALAAATNALLDVYGVALAGTSDPASEIVRATLPARRPNEATIWGSPSTASAEDAAFVNAVQAHVLDYDDSSIGMRGHPSAVMLPTALAVGETVHATGRDVLAAYPIGLEVAIRVTQGMGSDHHLRGLHPTGTSGIFGATAIAGRLWGLSATAMQHAFGIAGSQAIALSRNFGSMTKSFHAGQAARAAIQSVRLAKAGFTANEHIFEGPNNLFRTHGNSEDTLLAEHLETLGARWDLIDQGLMVKQWPCCYATHRAIAAVQRLRAEHGFNPREVTRIAIGFLPGTDGPLKYRTPHTGLEGKFSIEYVLAALLVDGELGIGTFTDANVRRPEVRELMTRVERYVIPHEDVFSGLSGYTDVTVEFAGQQVDYRMERTPGSSALPPTDDERWRKFMECACMLLPADEATAMGRGILDLGARDDVRQLWASRPHSGRDRE